MAEHEAFHSEKRRLAFTTAVIAEVPIRHRSIRRTFRRGETENFSKDRDCLPLNVDVLRLSADAAIRQVVIPLHA